ncbi:toxin YoeB [Caedimonas varicaedens]|jgi:toxin YoeB|uniref:Putative mRNA interferase YoeB n=1 Tax=Caedimonas varicaedens TaxID=1629334 RepID=A0A0K8MDL1_9PROT|nr:toxin YoeB [Caedimonas varicaedens]
MNLIFTDEAWKSYLYWQAYNKSILKKINAMIKEIMRAPFEGIGKPEPLRYELSGYWSRRITSEHRLVYKIAHDDLIILSTRYHYD